MLSSSIVAVLYCFQARESNILRSSSCAYVSNRKYTSKLDVLDNDLSLVINSLGVPLTGFRRLSRGMITSHGTASRMGMRKRLQSPRSALLILSSACTGAKVASTAEVSKSQGMIMKNSRGCLVARIDTGRCKAINSSSDRLPMLTVNLDVEFTGESWPRHDGPSS